jgi:hypothetical protein
MLTSTVVDGTNIVTATYDGSLSTEEMTALRERLNAVIEEHGAAKLLMEYGDVDLGRIEPKAWWEDLKSTGLLTDVEKVAVITDKGWVEKLSSLAGAVTPATVKVFATEERPAAIAWLTS